MYEVNFELSPIRISRIYSGRGIEGQPACKRAASLDRTSSVTFTHVPISICNMHRFSSGHFTLYEFQGILETPIAAQ